MYLIFFEKILFCVAVDTFMGAAAVCADIDTRGAAALLALVRCPGNCKRFAGKTR